MHFLCFAFSRLKVNSLFTQHQYPLSPVYYTCVPYLQCTTHASPISSVLHMRPLSPVYYICIPYLQCTTHASPISSVQYVLICTTKPVYLVHQYALADSIRAFQILSCILGESLHIRTQAAGTSHLSLPPLIYRSSLDTRLIDLLYLW